MFSNYIVKRKDYKKVEEDTFEVNGNLYKVDLDKDPLFHDDEVMNISYWEMFTLDGEKSDYILAFYKLESLPKEPTEWNDYYDESKPYVLDLS